MKSEFVDTFNQHSIHTSLPNQLEHGSRLVGRWLKDNRNGAVEIFANLEYDSRDAYVEIEQRIQCVTAHLTRIIHLNE